MDSIYENLKKYISDEQHRELECREYLQYAKHILFKETVIDYVNDDCEFRTRVGDTDYIISAQVKRGDSIKRVKAYVWELKAPQCYIYQKDNNDRLIPTSDLFKAENQLIHYYDQLKGTTRFNDEFGITHPDDVCIGGIIIGRLDRWVRGIDNENKKDNLLRQTQRIRDKYQYDTHKIGIITWDFILDNLNIPGKTVTTQKSESKPIRMSMPTDSTNPFTYSGSK
ncbi:hypothetical protein CEE37_03985 [candidate division LCP-89 bacterium B3_LCP]|uniref:Uncharacterized protein n=1 Tax=candidate division LCP-89 bacterium B3_LCP TaxID=2012998 RepID=A0A532V420_UNCL8|nr:MAG: hypothetical protein CEE37_03985 [candidate division LCP-89 bacterium B3_LCP]